VVIGTLGVVIFSTTLLFYQPSPYPLDQLEDGIDIYMTFLIFLDYAEEATEQDPITKTLAMFRDSHDYITKEVIANESYAVYRLKARQNSNSVLFDPEGASNEFIIPMARLHGDYTGKGNYFPLLEAALPRSVFNALRTAPFVRALDDVSETVGFFAGLSAH
jgi:hypothetical protein